MLTGIPDSREDKDRWASAFRTAITVLRRRDYIRVTLNLADYCTPVKEHGDRNTKLGKKKQKSVGLKFQTRPGLHAQSHIYVTEVIQGGALANYIDQQQEVLSVMCDVCFVLWGYLTCSPPISRHTGCV